MLEALGRWTEILVVEPFLEFENDVRDMAEERRQRLFNRKPLKRTPFPEGYIVMEQKIHVQFGVRPYDKGSKARYYLAVFEYFPLGLKADGSREGVTGSCLNAKLVVHEGLSSEMEFPVFIPVGKLVESGEVVRLGFFPSLVRLQELEDSDIVGVHTSGLGVPAREGLFRLIDRRMDTRVEGGPGENGESSAARGLVPSSQNQLPGQWSKADLMLYTMSPMMGPQ